MRVMTLDEMDEITARCNWATICTVSEDGSPYAIEATPFHMDGCHCFMINPRGGVWKNLRRNSRVLLKYTLTSPDLRFWAGVSCFGQGEFVSDKDKLREGWRLLGEVMNTDYSDAASRFERCKDRSPLLMVRFHTRTGRCSVAKGAPLGLEKLSASAQPANWPPPLYT